MQARFSHQRIDHLNAEQDQQIARSLRRSPAALIAARRNLNRWIKRDGRKPRAVFAEWRRIMDVLNRNEIADFLASDTPMARRLRQSSPFIGIDVKTSRADR